MTPDEARQQVEAARAADESAQRERTLVRSQSENRRVRDLAARQAAEIEELRARLGLADAMSKVRLDPPPWQLRHIDQPGHATVCWVLGDPHFDEVVRPEEIDGLNAWDTEIALVRTQRAFEKSITLATDYMGKRLKIDGIVTFLPGDILSGNIHAELRETNARTLLDSAISWLDPIMAGLKMEADAFGHVTVACVVGNHGRLTEKPRYKLRARDNIEWLLYGILARELARDRRIDIMVSDAMDLTVPVYSTKFLLHHGDQYRGGSGISGISTPLYLGHHRKTQRAMSSGRLFDWEVMGHWHRLRFDWETQIIVSGTLKGYDEFAYGHNFTYQPPQLAWWLTTPEKGVFFQTALEPQDRAAEGW